MPIDGERIATMATDRRAKHPSIAGDNGGASGRSAYAAAALERECGRVACAAEGERNDTLNRAAYSLGQLVAGGELHQATVADALLRAARGCGLPDSEATKTIASGMKAGAAEPRRAPEPDRRRRDDSLPPEAYRDDEGVSYDEPDGAPEDPETTAQPSRTPPTSPADIVRRWAKEGPLVRVPTGIEPLDRMCRGGLPTPWRVLLVGAPTAGKTMVQVIAARYMASADDGPCVGLLGVDEDPEDLTVRLLQMAGCPVDDAEQRDPSVLAKAAEDLARQRLRLYDSSWTVEAAAADLASWAKSEGRGAALGLDSVQTVAAAASADARTPREHVEGVLRAVRRVADRHRLLVIATSEANRASYRSDDAAEHSNDLASGAESRAIEFGAQTQLMLRTPKGHPDVIHVRVAKNRRAQRGEFWLRLDPERHTVSETDNPADDPGAMAERQQAARQATAAKVEQDARDLLGILRDHPAGLGEEKLRGALRAAGHRWGVERLNAARYRLGEGLSGSRIVDLTPPPTKGRTWAIRAEGGQS